MIYHLTLHRITLVVILAGLLFAGALTFGAGWLLGADWGKQAVLAAPAAETDVAETESESDAVPTSPATPVFAVQVAALTSAEDADALVAELASLGGPPPYVVTLQSESLGVLLRSVRVGPFTSRREADAEVARLALELGHGVSVLVEKNTSDNLVAGKQATAKKEG